MPRRRPKPDPAQLAALREQARQHVLTLTRVHGMSLRAIRRTGAASPETLQTLMKPGHPRRITAATLQAILAVQPDPLWWRTAARRVEGDATGTRRRLHALGAVGWNQQDLAAHMDAHPHYLYLWTHAPRVTAGTARRVDRCFRDLAMVPGPSRRAQASARRRGWAPPLAWDGNAIDDPNATPDLGAAPPRPTSRAAAAQRAAEARHMAAAGLERWEIAARLDLSIGRVTEIVATPSEAAA